MLAWILLVIENLVIDCMFHKFSNRKLCLRVITKFNSAKYKVGNFESVKEVLPFN